MSLPKQTLALHFKCCCHKHYNYPSVSSSNENMSSSESPLADELVEGEQLLLWMESGGDVG